MFFGTAQRFFLLIKNEANVEQVQAGLARDAAELSGCQGVHFKITVYQAQTAQDTRGNRLINTEPSLASSHWHAWRAQTVTTACAGAS